VSGYLLDTNCVSEAVKLRPDPQVADWIDSVDESLLFLSVKTLGEIRKGLANLEQGKRRTQLETAGDRLAGPLPQADTGRRPRDCRPLGRAHGRGEAARTNGGGRQWDSGGDCAALQPDGGFTQCERLCEGASGGSESLGAVTDSVVM